VIKLTPGDGISAFWQDEFLRRTFDNQLTSAGNQLRD
jgi:hypothetical protein